MRSALLTLAFYGLTALFAVGGLPLLLLPSPRPLRRWIQLWARSIRFVMRHIGGITVEYRGLESLPWDQAPILAAKHHSYADAILLFAERPDLAIVAMGELGHIPVVGAICRKLGMILVDRRSGRGALHLAKGAKAAAKDNRPILIYPEGWIPPLEDRVPYKKGIWHLHQASPAPVIPIATNLGLCWSQNKWRKFRGHAVVEILPALKTGLAQTAFMDHLEETIEGATTRLIAEARDQKTGHIPAPVNAADSLPAISVVPAYRRS